MRYTFITKSKIKLKYRNRVKFGKHFRCRKDFLIAIENDGKIVIGENCFFNNFCSLNSLQEIRIGNECIFGEGVKIYDHNHRFNERGEPIYKQGFTCGKVTIGNNCWVGSNVVILKGTIIGDNCVIGAGCVVRGEIPPNSIVTCNKQLKIDQIKYKDLKL